MAHRETSFWKSGTGSGTNRSSEPILGSCISCKSGNCLFSMHKNWHISDRARFKAERGRPFSNHWNCAPFGWYPEKNRPFRGNRILLSETPNLLHEHLQLQSPPFGFLDHSVVSGELYLFFIQSFENLSLWTYPTMMFPSNMSLHRKAWSGCPSHVG